MFKTAIAAIALCLTLTAYSADAAENDIMIKKGKVIHNTAEGINLYAIKTYKKTESVGTFGSFSQETEACLQSALEKGNKVELKGKYEIYKGSKLFVYETVTCKPI